MLLFHIDKMLFTIPAGQHEIREITEILEKHPEVQFVSFVGIDIGGHDTDEKIPVALFLENMEDMLKNGVQTDGSSVVLPGIADLGNAKVDIIPDLNANWYVDYNYSNTCPNTGGLPVGTLRIPSFLVHNDTFHCGSRSILKQSIDYFKEEVMKLLAEHPYVFEYIEGADSVDDIEELTVTSATELEFWVKTPDDKGDREQLFTAQLLKEQYWKRTYGDVRTALENTLQILDKYGFEVEMGHKEVGGVKAKMGHSGHYDHVMEQLEIDWKYSTAMQAADNENQIKYVVRDIFTKHGLDVTFMAKPFPGVAGSGEHTHIGLAARLKNGKMTSLFAARDAMKHYMSPVGFGALMGILKNYDVLNPFISASTDALNRLKPGYEAPVCTVTSLGKSVDQPSRNRTVLVGLIRSASKPLATRFELRSPNPKSNTYLVLASSFLAILDGLKAVLGAGKTPEELEKSLSKKYGEEDFYLEQYREYRSEEDVFDSYTEEERARIFGKAPGTVWQNLKAFDLNPEKMEIFRESDIFSEKILHSFRLATVNQWRTELHDRLIPATMNFVRSCSKQHTGEDFSDYDVMNWNKINQLRHDLAKDTILEKCLLSKTKQALDEQNYELASDLQLMITERLEQLEEMYENYKKNLF
jgi:glutamine synthetase